MIFDIDANINDLMIMLTDKYRKYTSNDHSSIPIEKVQQLMDSILYCINGYLNSVNVDSNSITTSDYRSANALYEKGLELEKENFARAKELLINIKKTSLKIDNMSYQDTIFGGLDIFFKKYDILYAAHETPADIDYQLCFEVIDFTGVEYILKYLEQLYVENIFCNKFDEKDIKALLKGYSQDYRVILINIFEIVLQNIIGLELIGNDILRLNIYAEDRLILQEMLEDLNLFELQDKLLLALDSILDKLDIKDYNQVEYAKKATVKISYDIKHCISIKKIDKIFITSDYKKDEAASTYKDGVQMSSDELRKFISEMQECRFTSDKIDMIKSSVHSLRDLIDILDTCIWDDEYIEVFKLLSQVELDILCQIVVSDMAIGYKLSELKSWQREFLKFEK